MNSPHHIPPTETTPITMEQLIDTMVHQFRDAITPIVHHQITAMSEEIIETHQISDQVYVIKPKLLDVVIAEGKTDTHAVILTTRRVNTPACYMLYYERKDVYDEKMRFPFMLRYMSISPTRNLGEQRRVEIPELYELEVQRQLSVLFAETIATTKRCGMLYVSLLPLDAASVVEAKEHIARQEKDHHV